MASKRFTFSFGKKKKDNTVNTLSDGNEVTKTKYLVARHYAVSSKVLLDFIYDNNETKRIEVCIGDNVDVTYTDDRGRLQKITGTVIDIMNKQAVPSFKSNYNVGNGNYNLVFTIDASEESEAKVYKLDMIDIFDIGQAAVDPGEDKPTNPIEWDPDLGTDFITVDKEKDSEVYVMIIPFIKNESGKETFVVSDGVNTLFKQVKDPAKEVSTLSDNPVTIIDTNEEVTPPEDETTPSETKNVTSFVWDMVDYSSLNGSSIEGLEYDEEGVYLFNEKDKTNVKEVAALATNYVAADTQLQIVITLTDEKEQDTVLTTSYTVTASDVEKVKSNEQPEPPVEEKVTVTTTVEGGTTENETVSVTKGETATIVCTATEGYKYKNVEVSDDTITPQVAEKEGTVTITLENVTKDTTVTVTFEKEEEPEPPVEENVTVTTNIEGGTTENETVTVKKGETATITCIASEGYKYKSVASSVEGITPSAVDTDGTVVITVENVTEDVTITVVFEKEEPEPPVEENVTVTTNVTGGTTENASVKVKKGETATVVCTADEDYEYKSVTSSVEGITPSAVDEEGTVTITVEDVTEDVTLTVLFEKKEVIPPVEENVTVTTTVEGGTTENGTVTVKKGETATITCTASEGYQYKSVEVSDDTITPQVNNAEGTVTITLENVTKDTTVKVTFEVIPVVPEPSIAWLDEHFKVDASQKQLFMKYDRKKAGTYKLEVSTPEKTVFAESFTAITTNSEAYFSWTLRDFSSLNGTSIEGLTYDENKNYIYKNGDNTISEVHAIDIDNSKIIPAGTVLNIKISGEGTEIEDTYTVTEEDVTNVTI